MFGNATESDDNRHILANKLTDGINEFTLGVLIVSVTIAPVRSSRTPSLVAPFQAALETTKHRIECLLGNIGRHAVAVNKGSSSMPAACPSKKPS